MLQVTPVSKKRSAYEWFLYRDYIDMKPGYQRRGDLWEPNKQALLINSMINSIDIPKIYFADFTFGSLPFESRSKLYAVIDGKQRLEAIFKFFSDSLPLGEHEVFDPRVGQTLSGLYYSDIKETYPHIASTIESYELTIMSVFSEDLKYIREMFIRLNQGVTVSGPEKRNAMHGPLPQITRDLSVHDFMIYHNKMPTSRGQDLNLMAKILLFESQEPFNTLGKATLDRYFKRHEESLPESFDYLISRIDNNFDLMTTIFKRPDSLLTSQNVVFLYYVFLATSQYEISTVRSFLDTFESHRKRVNARFKAGEIDEESANSILYDYIRLNLDYRSPDNRVSINRMVETLRKLYSSWLQNPDSISPGFI